MSKEITSSEINACLGLLNDDYENDMKVMSEFLKDIESNSKDSYSSKCYPYCLFENPGLEFNEGKILRAIVVMLHLGYDPNVYDHDNASFVENYISFGWEYRFIYKILSSIAKYQLEDRRFDVNHQDNYGSTLLHILFTHARESEDLEYILKILEIPEFSFDTTLKDKEGDTPKDLFGTSLESIATSHIEVSEELINNITDALTITKSLTTEEIDEEAESYDKDMKTLSHYGTILDHTIYPYEPAIGREKELESVFIALAKDRKNPLIIGESGVGKTCIIDELAYLLQQDRVPSFLEGQTIFELDRNALIGKTKYVGSLEQETKKCLDICVKYDILVFIDEMQSFKGAGSYENSTTDVLDIIQRYIDRLGLKVISTTTKADYLETFANSPLKRRFDPITIEEPSDEVMRMILKNYFENKQAKSQTQLDKKLNIEDIIDILIEYTEDGYRVYDDKQNNPDLALSIVESAYAKCLVRDSQTLEVEDFIYAFQVCDRLYKNAREFAIINLSNLATYDKIDRPRNNIIQFRPINPNK